jgi:hypothetical protein
MKYWHAIAFAVLAAVITAHGGAAGRVVGLSMVVVLCFLTARRASVGLLSVFPLLYILPSAPTSIGPAEFLFAALLSITIGRAIIEHLVSLQDLAGGRRLWFIGGGFVFIAVNFIVSRSNGIPLSDWLRGLAPFLFLSFLVPVYLIFKQEEAVRGPFLLSLISAAALFSAHVLAIYYAEELWSPHLYAYYGGNWVRVLDNMLDSGFEAQRFVMRVTLVLSQSTDPLVPVGVAWGLAGFVMLRSAILRNLSLALSVTAVSAVTLTLTRSMILALAVVVAGLGVFCLRRGRNVVARFLVGASLLTIVFGFIIVAFDLTPVYLYRANSLVPTTDGVWTDVNVSGKGLGVKHAMRFASGAKEIVVSNVGYVHSWLFYALMTGGVAGFSIYCLLLTGPMFLLYRGGKAGMGVSPYLIITVGFLIVYGLFFAVFRLISFNMLLGCVWGIALALEAVGNNKSSSTGVEDRSSGADTALSTSVELCS